MVAIRPRRLTIGANLLLEEPIRYGWIIRWAPDRCSLLKVNPPPENIGCMDAAARPPWLHWLGGANLRQSAPIYTNPAAGRRRSMPVFSKVSSGLLLENHRGPTASTSPGVPARVSPAQNVDFVYR
ncbi:hypothetical protein RRF57_005746 [Xylaria bambusicola]|uniref:Uncharacterized protein n=1 Tax=Xylaria bambusicola TaxID=326684 RepID=A0AAN7UP33_9PEZI